MPATVRRIRPGDTEVLRTIRLAALLDAPSAFGSTHEIEVAQPLDHWELRATLGSNGPDRTTYLAWVDGRPVGIAGGYRPADDASLVELVSMWTDPAHRRGGLGRRLVDEVVAWADATGADTVALWVTLGNDPAIRLYETAGFRLTGDEQRSPADAERIELRMTLAIGG